MEERAKKAAETAEKAQSKAEKKAVKAQVHDLKAVIHEWAAAQAKPLGTKLYDTEIDHLQVVPSPTHYGNAHLDIPQRKLAETFPKSIENQNASEVSRKVTFRESITVTRSHRTAVGLELGLTAVGNVGFAALEASLGLSINHERAKEKSDEREAIDEITVAIPGKHTGVVTMQVYQTPLISSFVTEVNLSGIVDLVFKDKLVYEKTHHHFRKPKLNEQGHKKHRIAILDIFRGFSKEKCEALHCAMSADHVTFKCEGEWVDYKVETAIKVGESQPLPDYVPPVIAPTDNQLTVQSPPKSSNKLKIEVMKGAKVQKNVEGKIKGVDVLPEAYHDDDVKRRVIEVQNALSDTMDSISVGEGMQVGGSIKPTAKIVGVDHGTESYQSVLSQPTPPASPRIPAVSDEKIVMPSNEEDSTKKKLANS